MQITKNTVASFEYTLKDDSGSVIDTSKGRAPLAYVHGAGSLIPGLEDELEGKQDGDSFQVRIPPERAYGERDERMVQDVPRAELPPEVDIVVGMQFRAESPAGDHIVTVVEVEGESVRLDGNHPLAGVPLNFEVAVVGVRAATPEEVEHGHVHGPGGHHHH